MENKENTEVVEAELENRYIYREFDAPVADTVFSSAKMDHKVLKKNITSWATNMGLMSGGSKVKNSHNKSVNADYSEVDE